MFLFYLSVFPGDKTDHHHTTCKTLLIMLHVAYWIVNIIDPVNSETVLQKLWMKERKMII